MPATTLNAVQIAEHVVLGGDDTVIVLELYNSGGSQRWGQQFPSLDREQLNALDDPTFLAFTSQKEAHDAFQQLTKDSSEQDAGGLITGTITLVTRPWGKDDGVETIAWDLQDDTRPVFQGREWTHETIAERI